MADISSNRFNYKPSTNVSSVITLNVGKPYHFTQAVTVTLPNVSSLQDNTKIRMTKDLGVEPIINVDGTNSENIYVQRLDNFDTGIIFDIESEIILVWKTANNRWEV